MSKKMIEEKLEDTTIEEQQEEIVDGLPDEAEEEILVLKNTIENLQNKMALLQADTINYRKRKDEEVSNMLKFANQDLIMEILPIVDNFDRAFKLEVKDDSIVKFLEGFKLLYSSLIDVLKKFGVEELDVLDKPFDPNICEALMTNSDSTKEDDIVVDVLLKGYSLKGRLIRPAKVIVNKK